VTEAHRTPTDVAPDGMWISAQAFDLCRFLEAICVRFGCHVGLTGGLLYKHGPRKDCDVVVYRAGLADPTVERPSFHEEVDRSAMIAALETGGLVLVKEYTRVVKFLADGRPLDLIFPECDGAYEPETEEDPDLAMEMKREDAELFS